MPRARITSAFRRPASIIAKRSLLLDEASSVAFRTVTSVSSVRKKMMTAPTITA